MTIAKFEVGKAYGLKSSTYRYVCVGRHREDTKRPKVGLNVILNDGTWYESSGDDCSTFIHCDESSEFVYLRRNEVLRATDQYSIKEAVDWVVNGLRDKDYHRNLGCADAKPSRGKPTARPRKSKKGSPISGIIIIVMIALLLRACVGG